MARHILSKSGFIRGVQCHKSLYLNRFHSNLRDPLSAEMKAKFTRGHTVGTLAQQLFPGGTDIRKTAGMSVPAVIKHTAEAIQRGETVIYEAGFEFEGIIIIMDILVQDEQGWHAYEVKSSVEIKEVYRLDAAFQYYIIEKSGLPLRGISIIHVTEAYTGQTIEHPWTYFRKEDIKAYAIEKQGFIEKEIQAQRMMLALKRLPAIAMGEQCDVPYPCDFKGFCSQNPVD